MAQITGGSTTDFVAKRKQHAALRVLRRAADRCAADAQHAYSASELAAVFLLLFIEPWSSSSLHLEERQLDEWHAIAPDPRTVLARTRPSMTDTLAGHLIADLEAELSVAIAEWARGNPEQPETTSALNAIEQVLFAHHVWTRPPKPSLTTSLRSANAMRG